MKSISSSMVSRFAMLLSVLFLVVGCKKNSNNNSQNNNQARLQVRLTDSPDPNVKEVWVDIRSVIIKMSDSADYVLNGAHPGIYNLLDLTNGKDTLLADAEIPTGHISQIRLLLGTENYVITNDNKRIDLTTPSAQQSGLKVQIHQDVTGGNLYRLILDFDAGKSVVKAGNSGKYILKPVLRVLSFQSSGGSLKGVVAPDSIITGIYAIIGPDTIASTFTQVGNGNYLIRDIAPGTYSLSYVPGDTIHKTASRSVPVNLGQTTLVDTVKLEKK
ncbi:MAG TPA: DUF4382 domain-containing protein [Phnomibacter sp.]|nr:DUF4382 domain-containing protein [Phnomibacter sp.]